MKNRSGSELVLRERSFDKEQAAFQVGDGICINPIRTLICGRAVLLTNLCRYMNSMIDLLCMLLNSCLELCLQQSYSLTW